MCLIAPTECQQFRIMQQTLPAGAFLCAVFMCVGATSASKAVVNSTFGA
jgi:hypothetical protein